MSNNKTMLDEIYTQQTADVLIAMFYRERLSKRVLLSIVDKAREDGYSDWADVLKNAQEEE